MKEYNEVKATLMASDDKVIRAYGWHLHQQTQDPDLTEAIGAFIKRSPSRFRVSDHIPARPQQSSFNVPQQSDFSVPQQSGFNVPQQSGFSVPQQFGGLGGPPGGLDEQYQEPTVQQSMYSIANLVRE
ncbi:hypothetical protein M430DRAFT_164782 [Amorphotheca resinae ATCC 22711]|jgi:hypothetical protein|uniref:Uncharacterized protein n=1 Tax=Amorphotheca resinae ATCC 22711 TaxID=857342 RepID=A0A2T3BFP8_AMORE|nr:hypothetical protein M430DRAFT_164782 [Amorphotheca resinae ATCC 22711]PSS28250.1 hypothetical protein M430DRAFT_164782 [Amorphotheca resinae ATCC 22711]